jgi:hypothetical protein
MDKVLAEEAEVHGSTASAWGHLIDSVRDVPDEPLDSPTLSVLQDMDAIIRRHGARPIFLATPTITQPDHRHQLIKAHRQGVISELFDFTRPSTHPEYYVADIWHDAVHLKRHGAVELSKDIGNALCDALREAGE